MKRTWRKAKGADIARACHRPSNSDMTGRPPTVATRHTHAIVVHRWHRLRFCRTAIPILDIQQSRVHAAGQSHSRLEVAELVSEAQLLPLEREWNELVCQSRPHSIFFRHEWFASAWAWRRRDSQLRILTARRGHSLVG